jgi:hypothetical protein
MEVLAEYPLCLQVIESVWKTSLVLIGYLECLESTHYVC